MGDLRVYLREDWARARATLERQIRLFELETIGPDVTLQKRQRTIARLRAALSEYDRLLEEYQPAE